MFARVSPFHRVQLLIYNSENINQLNPTIHGLMAWWYMKNRAQFNQPTAIWALPLPEPEQLLSSFTPSSSSPLIWNR